MRYYYEPYERGYIKTLKKLVTAGGYYSTKRALLDDVMSDAELSPDERKVYNKYYNGNKTYLEQRVKEDRDELNRLWKRLESAADAAGIAMPSSEERKKFCQSIIAQEQHCDLRAVLHGWLNTSLKRMELGQEVILPNPDYEGKKGWKRLKIPTIAEILVRYDKLCEKRRS